MTSIVVNLSDLELDPAATLDSGQVFRWRHLNESRTEWMGIVSGAQFKVTRKVATLVGSDRNSFDFDELISRYFSAGDRLESIFSSFPSDDPLLNSALSRFSGLRLITQDPWECLVSFVCSINCNIPSIKLKIENLSRKYGKRIDSSLDEKSYSFPTARALSKAEKNDLLNCKLGFRWRYVKFIAQKVAAGDLDLEKIYSMPYKAGLSELISKDSGKTFGVGPKVADCVLLYSFHKSEAFPLDVWIMKCVKKYYSTELNKLPEKLTLRNYLFIAESMRERFGINAGYAQLYLYEKIRRDSVTQSKARA
ncbi:MAG: hypothetical protein OK439_01220 [Thaumarchaeota archaeon]|nr:hypothetical protein [Nitrososphaerota archaeon]